MYLSYPVIALGAAGCMAVGYLGATFGAWVWKRIRQQQGNWPPSEPLQRRAADSWQARHREEYDRARRIPARHRMGGIGVARIRKLRIGTRRTNK